MFYYKIEHIITKVFRPGPKFSANATTRKILCIVAYFCHKMAAGWVFNSFSHYSISPVVTLPHSSPIRPSVSEEDAPQGHLVVSLVVVPEPMVSHVVVSHMLGMPLLTNIAVFLALFKGGMGGGQTHVQKELQHS